MEKVPAERSAISPDAVASQYGANEKAVQAFVTFASQHGVEVISAEPGRRVVHVRGTVAQLEQMFGTTLHDYVAGSRNFRGRQGPLFLPPDIAATIEAVMGLDDRPVAAPRVAMPRTVTNMVYPSVIAEIYGFPKNNGSGQTVVLIELGGAFDDAELTQYFAAANLPKPSVSAVSVSPGSPVAYGADSDSDGEVMLDVEVVGAIAPGAKIDVYFSNNDDRSFYESMSRAVHAPGTSVISISWGGPKVRGRSRRWMRGKA